MTPERTAALRASFTRQTMMATIGATIVEVGEGHCTLAAPIGAGFRQQHGVGHAGLTFTLGDTAAGYAAATLMPEGSDVMTAEMKINLLRPAAGERLIATGKVAKTGRKISVVTAEVWAEDAAGERKLIAILQGTMVPA